MADALFVHDGAALMPLIAGLLTSTITAKTSLAWSRGGQLDRFAAGRPFWWQAAGVAAFPAQVLLYVFAFFVVWWPLALIGLIALTALFSFIVRDSNLAFWTTMQPILNVCTIALCLVTAWLVFA